MKKEFKEKVFNAFLDYYEKANQNIAGTAGSATTFWSPGKSEYLYMKIFNEIPHAYRPGRVLYTKDKNRRELFSKTVLDKLEKELLNNPKIIVRTEARLFLKDGNSLEERQFKYCISEEGFILELYCEECGNFQVNIYSSSLNKIEELKTKYFQPRLLDKEKVSRMRLITRGRDGFQTDSVDIKTVDFEGKNYNLDIPHDEVMKELGKYGSGLMIFHGRPGCGKTTYIRSLIKESNRPFLYFDPKMLSQVTSDNSMLELLLENRGAVVVIEDCEKLIQARSNKGGDSELNTLLNLTDGLLGDSLDLKFICTFNSPLSTIDSALLRKGRLKVIYEFKELEKSRVQEIAEMLGKKDIPNKDMAICDVYNWESGKMEEIKTGTRRSIGFTMS